MSAPRLHRGDPVRYCILCEFGDALKPSLSEIYLRWASIVLTVTKRMPAICVVYTRILTKDQTGMDKNSVRIPHKNRREKLRQKACRIQVYRKEEMLQINQVDQIK